MVEKAENIKDVIIKSIVRRWIDLAKKTAKQLLRINTTMEAVGNKKI
jgi:hypothetical protein